MALEQGHGPQVAQESRLCFFSFFFFFLLQHPLAHRHPRCDPNVSDPLLGLLLPRPPSSYLQLLSRRPPKTAIPPDALLRNLLYSCLGGLFRYLDTNLPEVRKCIDVGALNCLDWSTTSIDAAIKLLGNLLSNLSTSCIMIIDKFQFLDKPAIKPHFLAFVNLFGLHDQEAEASFKGDHKLLLTSAGLPSVLTQ